MIKKGLILVITLLLTAAALVACQPQTVEVTRVVDGEAVIVTRIVQEDVEVPVEVPVEVTRIVEVPQIAPTVTPVPAGEVRRGGTLVQAITSLPGNYNTFNWSGGSEKRGIEKRWGGHLGWIGIGETYEPYLAKSWEINEDYTEFTFHLVEGAVWHDGEPFTADDVVFSLERHLNADTGSPFRGPGQVIVGAPEYTNGEADSVSGITKVDDSTVRIETSVPSANMLYDIFLRVGVGPMHIWENIPPADGNGSEYATTNMIGIGPWKFVRVVPDEFIELERFDDFFGETANIERYVYRAYPNGATALAALQAGEVDITEVSGTDVALVNEEPFLDIYTQLKRGTFTLWLNLDDPQLQDIRVRQAIAHAIDIQGIIGGPFGGFGLAWPHAFTPDWTVNPAVQTYAYNPQLARDLLAEAGYPDGLELDTFTSYYTGDEIPAIQAMLANVGIDLEAESIEAVAWLEKAAGSEGWSLALGSGLAGDPAGLVNWVEEGGGQNFSKYSNDHATELMIAGGTTADLDERADIYQEVDLILNTELPWISLFRGADIFAVNTRIANFDTDRQYWDHANTWFLYE